MWTCTISGSHEADNPGLSRKESNKGFQEVLKEPIPDTIREARLCGTNPIRYLDDSAGKLRLTRPLSVSDNNDGEDWNMN